MVVQDTPWYGGPARNVLSFDMVVQDTPWYGGLP